MTNGLRITSVQDGALGQQAGLRVGDVLLTYFGYQLRTPEDLNAAIQSAASQKHVKLSMLRGGQLIETSIYGGALGVETEAADNSTGASAKGGEESGNAGSKAPSPKGIFPPTGSPNAIVAAPSHQFGLGVGPASVVVVDVSMPFGSMVAFMVKWAIASIPALVILSIVGAVVAAMFGAMLGVATR